MTITQTILATSRPNPARTYDIILHNDHYHGRDHLSFIVREHIVGTGRRFDYNHRTLRAACKRAHLRLEEVR